MRSLSCDFLPSRAPCLSSEQFAFAVDGSLDGRFICARQQEAREGDVVVGVALAREAGLAGVHLVETLGDDGEIDPRDSVVEPEHDLAAANSRALAHQQLADDAAGEVLHLFDV